MPKTLLSTCLILPLGALARPVLDEASALARLEDASLAELRAGAPLAPALPLVDLEHERLAAADAAAGDLVDLRAGDISNQDLMTILLVLGIVALIVIIA